MKIKKAHSITYYLMPFATIQINSIAASIPHSEYIQNNTVNPIVVKTNYYDGHPFRSCEKHIISDNSKYSIPTKNEFIHARESL
jgi:hypothetical protein